MNLDLYPIGHYNVPPEWVPPPAFASWRAVEMVTAVDREDRTRRVVVMDGPVGEIVGIDLETGAVLTRWPDTEDVSA